MANSKLDSYDRELLNNIKCENPALMFHNNEETTIVFKDRANYNTIEFALSVMSPYEKKFRRKVGEFYAADRFLLGQTVKMKRSDFFTMLENLYDFR